MKHIIAIMLSAMVLSALPAGADEVRLTTALHVGDTLTLAVNDGTGAVLTWNNGQRDSLADGRWNKLVVRDAGATLVTEHALTGLCISESALTDLDLSQATDLQTLICDGNRLTRLDVSRNVALEALSCSDNVLAELHLAENTALRQLDCANNRLVTLGLAGLHHLETLICSGNRLVEIAGLADAAGLRQLWCGGNALATLNLESQTGLTGVVAVNNKLTAISVGPSAGLRDIWVDGNRLTQLSLDRQNKLESVSAADNDLVTVSWDYRTRMTCRRVYLQNNRLTWSALVDTAYRQNLLDVVQFPQRSWSFPEPVVPNVKVDLSEALAKNGWNRVMVNTMTLTDARGTVLEEGTDYVASRNAIVFLKPLTGVVLGVKSAYYREQSLVSGPFNVTSSTAVQVPENNVLNVRADAGTIVLSAARPRSFRIVGVDGVQVASGELCGTRCISVPAGVYIVSGNKILVP